MIAGFLLFIIIPGKHAPGQVLVNQVGYLPQAEKRVLTGTTAENYSVISSDNGEVVFDGDFSAYLSIDPGTGITASIGDFTQIRRPGNYFIVTANQDTSPPFTISDTVYNAVFNSSLKGFYFQRCGTALTAQYAGEYTHDLCHPMDGVFHVSTDTAGFLPAQGGWHDAGDFGKYVVNAGISVGTLLMAYEYFPSRFYTDDLGIPESGNGVPDILDEARYELEWLLTMVNTDGGVFHKLTSKQFAGEVMPEDHEATRYVYEISSAATADLAAVMARGARIYQHWDLEFAQMMFVAAQQAWSYLEAHPNIVPSGGFQNPDDTNSGEYGDGNDADERLWAAAELFASTGQEAYREYFETHYDDGQVFAPGFAWPSVGTLAQLTYLVSEYSDETSAINSDLVASFQNACDEILDIRNQSQFGTALAPGEYVWGSNSVALNRAILLSLGFEEFGDSTYYHAALDQLHYILGRNIHDMSFVTGAGTRSPQHIHHRQSRADGIDAPVPGLLAGGPNEFLSDPTLQSHFDENTPPAVCYVDLWGSYASNEIAINWNAPLVFLAGYFTPPDSTQTGTHGAGQSVLPRGIDLQQNFPNPFNGKTQIRYTLEKPQKVALQLYDVQGQLVAKIPLGMQSAGDHTCQLTPADFQETNLSSGVYFFRVVGTQVSNIRKLVLLK